MSARSQRNKCLSQVSEEKCRKKDYCWQYGPFADACKKVLYESTNMEVDLAKQKEDLKQQAALTAAVAPDAESTNSAKAKAGVASLSGQQIAAPDASTDDQAALAAAAAKKQQMIIAAVVVVVLVGGAAFLLMGGSKGAATTATVATAK